MGKGEYIVGFCDKVNGNRANVRWPWNSVALGAAFALESYTGLLFGRRLDECRSGIAPRTTWMTETPWCNLRAPAPEFARNRPIAQHLYEDDSRMVVNAISGAE